MQVEHSSSESGQEGKTVEQYYKTVSQKVDELLFNYVQVNRQLEMIISMLNIHGKSLDIIVENVAYDEEEDRKSVV